MRERKYSTVEVAKMLGMQQSNLQRAIAEGRIAAPPVVEFGPMRVRLWTREEIAAAREQLKRRAKR